MLLLRTYTLLSSRRYYTDYYGGVGNYTVRRTYEAANF